MAAAPNQSVAEPEAHGRRPRPHAEGPDRAAVRSPSMPSRRLVGGGADGWTGGLPQRTLDDRANRRLRDPTDQLDGPHAGHRRHQEERGEPAGRRGRPLRQSVPRRRLNEHRYPYVWLDAKVAKVREGGRTTSLALLPNPTGASSSMRVRPSDAQRVEDRTPRLEGP